MIVNVFRDCCVVALAAMSIVTPLVGTVAHSFTWKPVQSCQMIPLMSLTAACLVVCLGCSSWCRTVNGTGRLREGSLVELDTSACTRGFHCLLSARVFVR
ncbi:hypothetical protein TraAM80_05781 [Trypanosoma rangeli]|uniref:Uncharacterized protein n=1 Tax=Trypanosoma rangeli TaxID=5698 RepID=A0A3R7KL72_TRYRA|nr:uncharacterized protein TraAM80_05781 [Trypanosoma rangeli]RNF03682.1 hypothetical protein TraAM80_05781 [Trypanosoma rangeli]|eukprot:RNF03682.1 hypothetical protein TraAM80_05781 [Trypanosoma rangeli]